DAEQRYPELEYRLRRLWGRRLDHGLRTSGENDATRTERAHVGVTEVPGMDLAIDTELADATRDQLGVLSAEIENQDAIGVDVCRRYGALARHCRHGSRSLERLRRCGNWAPPW